MRRGEGRDEERGGRMRREEGWRSEDEEGGEKGVEEEGGGREKAVRVMNNALMILHRYDLIWYFSGHHRAQC